MQLRLALLQFLSTTRNVELKYQVGLVVLLALTVALACLPWIYPRPLRRTFLSGASHRATFWVAIMVSLVWARLPSLLAPMLNPDEALFTAAAVRLLHDPLFWQSVDTGSSGPLNVFPLTLIWLTGLMPDLASSRLTGVAMMAISTCLLHGTLARLYGERIARLGTLPVVGALAFMKNPDFVHFSSEHCPVLLLSIMLYLIARFCTARGDGPANAPVFFCGLVAGLMPFTKMQGLPIAAALCLVLLHAVWLRHKRHAAPTIRSMGLMVLGSLVPAAMVALYLTAFSIWEPFLRSYLQTNLLFYAGFNGASTTSKLDNFIGLVRRTKDLRALVVTTGIFSCAAVAMMLFRGPHREQPRQAQPLIAYAVIYLLAAGVAVATPGNPFPHYLLFLVMPMGFLTGTVLGKVCNGTAVPAMTSELPMRTTQFLLALTLLVGICVPLGHYLKRGNPYLPLRAAFLENFRGPIAQAIRRAAPPGSSMAVWGFSAELFIDSEMVQSNRYGCTVWQIEKNPLQNYFLDEFLVDMRKTRPLLFVDAMTPGMFYMWPIDRSKQGHDAFPEVGRHISTDYQLLEEVGGVRIYRLKSSAGKSSSS